MSMQNRVHGFTLIEVLIAAVFVGIAIGALMGATRSFTMVNGAGVDISTAEYLVEQIRELTAMLPVMDPQTETVTFGTEEASLADFDDVDDFDGQVFSPPIDAGRQTLGEFASFSQQITVENVSANDFTSVVSDGTSVFYRVTLRIFQNNKEVTSATWIRARY